MMFQILPMLFKNSGNRSNPFVIDRHPDLFYRKMKKPFIRMA